MTILKTLAMAGAAALTLGATAIATLSPADAQAYRTGTMLRGPAPLGIAGAAFAAPGAPASTTFGYPNWPYANGYYNTFVMPDYYGRDRYGY